MSVERVNVGFGTAGRLILAVALGLLLNVPLGVAPPRELLLTGEAGAVDAGGGAHDTGGQQTTIVRSGRPA